MSDHWEFRSQYDIRRQLGAGGQGVVYLATRTGAYGYQFLFALKVFDPTRHSDSTSYREAMAHIARVATRVASLEHNNLVRVNGVFEHNQIVAMEMEWIDGFDLRQLLCKRGLQRIRDRVSSRRWGYINNVIATEGPEQTRFKPGVAVAIVRECLAGLAALHHENIVHGDVKPSNVMLKRTGTAKMIDIGSAFDLRSPPPSRTCTPIYAAPEVLQNEDITPRSDLASLGYVLVEMLSGRQPFGGMQSYKELLEAKRQLPELLPKILPSEVTCNELLMSFCRGLIAPNPMLRFPDAEAATLLKEGAAAFLRQLVKGDMSSEYSNEIRLLMEELMELDDFGGDLNPG